MRLWIGLHLPRLPLEVFAPNWSTDTGSVVLDGERVLVASNAALAAGVSGGLSVHLQPIVTPADGAIAGVEALVRWTHPTRGFVAPDEFVPVAEQEGLIGAVELAPIEGQPGKRAFDAFLRAFEAGILTRVTGDIIALSPPLIITEAQIDELIATLGKVLKAGG